MRKSGLQSRRVSGGVQVRRGAQERQRLMALYKRGGQTQRRFCSEQGLALSTLRAWLGQARHETREDSGVQLVDVTAKLHAAASRVRVKIRLSKRVEISIPVGADAAWVGDLLSGVMRCCG